MMTTSAETLRTLLAQDRCHIMPCCYDGLTARLVEQAGFPLTFMSGFAVSAARLGLPDTGLISYGEMLDQGMSICSAVSIPVIGDGDTGYGNAMNVRRTVEGYARAGFSAVMIEDQVSPKRCGHTKGKSVVPREEACERIQAAVDVRNGGSDILILARTDAGATHGLGEAIDRANAFSDLGADILFVEAPRSVEEMEKITRQAPGIHMANIIEGGKTSVLSPEDLHDIGFRIAAYPLALISAAMQAITDALKELKNGTYPTRIMDFASVRKQVGFEDYYDMEKRYAASRRKNE
ncbi:MAG: isocitrate lyase/PEP mutase family protein [Desulfobacterales bacterium]|nr:isocitrate lyase/PEP mutase family protein [Desulfobacterales bacterium]